MAAQNTFDYIIAGGGMAGLSLAYYISESAKLRDKKILVIDRDAKTANDHTWCFWERAAGAFEPVVFRRWKSVRFHGTGGFAAALDLGGYEYKMIRASDFYGFVFDRIGRNPNFEILQSEIISNDAGNVKTAAGDFAAREFVFDSFTRKTYDDPKYQNLFQHFRGWIVETDRDAFDPREPTLFDFRVPQRSDCRFIYILPFSTRRALVEFTVFSGTILERAEYEENLKTYLAEILSLENYKIIETEAGIIPMSDEPHDRRPDAKTVRIGTTGGYVKASTGYSFKRTQNYLQKLLEELENPENQNPKLEIRNRFWKSYLDSVLLDVLSNNKHAADEVFTALFSKNETARVLKFLDEETSLAEDLRVMKTVPLGPFASAALETAVKKLVGGYKPDS